jgi:hypothetical protein
MGIIRMKIEEIRQKFQNLGFPINVDWKVEHQDADLVAYIIINDRKLGNILTKEIDDEEIKDVHDQVLRLYNKLINRTP